MKFLRTLVLCASIFTFFGCDYYETIASGIGVTVYEKIGTLHPNQVYSATMVYREEVLTLQFSLGEAKDVVSTVLDRFSFSSKNQISDHQRNFNINVLGIKDLEHRQITLNLKLEDEGQKCNQHGCRRFVKGHAEIFQSGKLAMVLEIDTTV